MEVVAITDTEVEIRLKGVKTGRAPGIGKVVRGEMAIVEQIEIKWTKRLLHIRMILGMVPARVTNRANFPNMEAKGRRARPREIRFEASHS